MKCMYNNHLHCKLLIINGKASFTLDGGLHTGYTQESVCRQEGYFYKGITLTTVVGGHQISAIQYLKLVTHVKINASEL